MTTAPIADGDPYLLPMPSALSPAVIPQWISPGNRATVSHYQDPVWSLAPLIDSPSTRMMSLHWKNCPKELRHQVKLAAWTMINGQLRPTLLTARGSAARPRRSAEDMGTTCREWMRLARWLHARGITELADCTEDEWREYAGERWAEGVSRRQAWKIMSSLTNLWAFDQLSARSSGVIRPPWDIEGADDFLPADDGGSSAENLTEPLSPDVIGPLLVWAIRMVEDFADDIFAAWAETRRLTAQATTNPSTAEGLAALKGYLLPLLDAQTPIPSNVVRGRTVVARSFIAGTTGASVDQVAMLIQQHGISATAAEQPGPCPLQVPVTGTINGRPWREHLDYKESAALMRHLGTAALIVCLYLTGMRPQEVQGLRSGCCPDPDPADSTSPRRHLIRSTHYKNVTDHEGNHVSAGEERDVPWVAITPVVHAIRVLERIVPDGELLLSAAHHDFSHSRRYRGALKYGALNRKIENFVTWVNQEAPSQNLPHQIVPKDPHGRIGLSRFRRTLAWHIARRPGGLIALAIQYGHMRTALDARTSSGYATRSRRGLHSELDVETALAAADTAAHLRDRIAAGEGISGPAARRAITATVHAPRFEGRLVPKTFAKKAAAYLARDGIVLFDNPEAFLICAFKRDTALCEPAPDATAPNQFACQAGCGNAVRTDSHARELGKRADDLDRAANRSPEPIRKRLRANAERLRGIAQTHHTTAQLAEALT